MDKTQAFFDFNSRSQKSAYNFVGEKLGHFVVRELIGQGGMGAVFKAYDETLDRNVAIKLILDAQQNKFNLLSLKKEAQILAKLQHPNIGAIHLLMEEAKHLFFVMDYYSGHTLDYFIKKHTGHPPVFEITALTDYMLQILNGLRYAHQMKVIHKDLKPANIILDEHGRIHIMDFGLADFFYTSMHRSNKIAGTPSYMSPEQSQGLPINSGTDIYATGVIFYELLTGKKPFEGKTLQGLFKQINEGTYAKPRSIYRQCPKDMERIVLKMMAKHVNDRFQSVDEIMTALDTFRTSSVSSLLGLKYSRKHATEKSNGPAPSHRPQKIRSPLFTVKKFLWALTLCLAMGAGVVWFNRYKNTHASKIMDRKYQQAVNFIHLNRQDLAKPLLLEIVSHNRPSETVKQAKILLSEIVSNE